MGFFGLKEFFDNIPDGVSVIGSDMKIEWVNKVLHEKGFHREGVAGKKCYLIYKNRSGICKQCPALKALTKKKTVRMYERGADGKGYEVTAIPYIENGNVEKIIEIVREVKRSGPFAVSLSSSGPALAFVINPSGKIVATNKKVRTVLGFSEKELTGKSMSSIMSKESSKEFSGIIQGIISGKRFPFFESEFVSKKGVKSSFEISCSPFYSNGDALGVEIITRDISEKKSAQKELVAEKEKAEKYLDIIGNIVVALDKKGNITMLNSMGYNVLGYKKGSLEGKNWFDTCIPKRVSKDVKKVFSKCMSGKLKLVEHYENPLITKSKEERLIRWHNTVLRDSSGNISGTISSGEDITERLLARKILNDAKRKYRLIFELCPLSVLIFDKEGVLYDANPYAGKFFGYKNNEILGKKIEDIPFIEQSFRNEAKEKFRKIAKKKKLQCNDMGFVTKSGRKKRCQVSANAITGDKKEFEGAIVIVNDITELFEAHEHLKRICRK